jgi:GNAT superfamily N-acetyltransferase
VFPPENEKSPEREPTAPEATSPPNDSSIPQYAVAVSPDLEGAELAAFLDLLRASPELGDVAEIGGATCALLRRVDSRMFNRVLNLVSTEPLDEIAEFYGDRQWWVSDSRGLGEALEQHGFARDYSWMKFTRGVAPREAHSDLDVVRVGQDRAEDFGRVVAGGFEMPDWATPLGANVVGRPGWSCYVAYDGEAPAGAGALFVHEQVGWLGFGATLAAFRGRGAQSAILAARIEDARTQGCTIVVTETGELQEGRPSSSYRNILRAGFREAGIRPNYRAP